MASRRSGRWRRSRVRWRAGVRSRWPTSAAPSDWPTPARNGRVLWHGGGVRLHGRLPMSVMSATPIALDPHAAEAALRVDLAACYRLVAHFGLDDLIYNHISARLPGPDHHFLINPYGLLFSEITASSFVKIDLEGRKVEPSNADVNLAGFVIHSAIHAGREDAMCVLH